eukprot:Hpha_TRINITY_DN15869_c1_g6::TRINITY_DN15869_c1_g6_i2::g.191759::m.191759/K18458/ACY3; N-acyl-aromatic-L-amino acid amidohydrolase
MRYVGPDTPIRHVAVIGGTHGNEATGVAVARSLTVRPPPLPPGVRLTVDIGNPAAVEWNTRYVDTDLNREFSLDALRARGAHLEGRRAAELNKLLGPKEGVPSCDLLLDLHTTTSATGFALMMHPRDLFAHELAAFLKSAVDSELVLVEWADRDARTLPSVARSGMTLEMGPLPWGVPEPRMYARCHAIVAAALRYVAAHNSPTPPPRRQVSVSVFANALRTVPFPKKDGLPALLHPSLLGTDFTRPLCRGDPVFVHHDGEETVWQEDNAGLWPFFVGEAAYFESDIAFALATRRDRTYDPLHVTVSGPKL